MLIFQCIPLAIGFAYGETPCHAKDNSERSKDQTAHSITNRTRSTMRQCVSAISGLESGSWVESLYLSFSQSKQKKKQTLVKVVLRTSALLLA